MSEPWLQDPTGYAITYGAPGGFDVTRLSDHQLIANDPTRGEAVAAALADRDGVSGDASR